MAWYSIIIVLVLLAIQCEAQIEIYGTCPENMGSKLRINWLAMSGKWYEVLRSSKISPLQLGSSCVTFDITNVGRYMCVTHSYKNILNQMITNPSVFELNSDPEINFLQGIPPQRVTLMGTDYVNYAAYTNCERKTTTTSNIYFWVHCRQNTLTPICKGLATFNFKLRNAENMLSFLEYTDQNSCPT